MRLTRWTVDVITWMPVVQGCSVRIRFDLKARPFDTDWRAFFTNLKAGKKQ